VIRDDDEGNDDEDNQNDGRDHMDDPSGFEGRGGALVEEARKLM